MLNRHEKSYVIDVAVFGVTVLCITNQDQFDVFIEHNKEVLDDKADINSDKLIETWNRSNGASIHLECGDEAFFILMLRNKSHITACHECVHMSAQILVNKGVPITQDNDEVRAYLTGYLFEELCKAAKLKYKQH